MVSRIYSVAPNFWIASSVFKGNTGDVTLYTEKPLANVEALIFPARDNLVTNSTFLKIQDLHSILKMVLA